MPTARRTRDTTAALQTTEARLEFLEKRAEPEALEAVRIAREGFAAGRFTLRFFGGRHEPIHSSIPDIDNVGVLVSDRLYYPGDSYAVPEGVAVDTLAAPVGAPWLRLSDAVDFVLAVKPRRAFGTHDMTLSVIGKNMHRQRLQWATEQGGGEFLLLEPGDAVDL